MFEGGGVVKAESAVRGVILNFVKKKHRGTRKKMLGKDTNFQVWVA